MTGTIRVGMSLRGPRSTTFGWRLRKALPAKSDSKERQTVRSVLLSQLGVYSKGMEAMNSMTSSSEILDSPERRIRKPGEDLGLEKELEEARKGAWDSLSTDWMRSSRKDE